MIDVSCPECRRRVLVGAGDILGVETVDGGSVVSFRCPCGATGAEFVARRRRPGRVARRRVA